MGNSKEQKFIGVMIDNIELCKKASQKTVALSRLSSYLHNSEKKLIFNSTR